MQKRKLFLSVILFGCLLLLHASKNAPLSINQALNQPKNWKKNCAGGNMKISYDSNEKALRFDVDFSKVKDGTEWVYPKYSFEHVGALSGAQTLSFEIKVLPDGVQKIRGSKIMISKGKYFQSVDYNILPDGQYKTITINLEKLKFPAKEIRGFNIGMNPDAKKFTYFIRNIKITGDAEKFFKPKAQSLHPVSASLNQAAKWQRNCAGGKMKISHDKQEKAIRMDADFTNIKKGSQWVYPKYSFGQPGALSGAQTFSFEIKVLPDGVQKIRGSKIMISKDKSFQSVNCNILPDGQYKTITVNLEKLKFPAKEIRGFNIGMNPDAKKITYFIRNIKITGNLSVMKKHYVFEAAQAIKTSAPANVFIASKTPSFTLFPSVKVDSINYEIKDWHGQSVDKGVWTNPKEGALTIKKLPCGYYTLTPSSSFINFRGYVPFNVVVDPAKRIPSPNSFFAMDTALSEQAERSYNNRQPLDTQKTVAELLRRAGVFMTRDRMSWKYISPKPHVYNWKGRNGRHWGAYDRNWNLLHERGIQVMPMFGDSPDWTKNTPSSNASKKTFSWHCAPPDDLFALYDFAKTFTSTYKNIVTAGTFQNEHGDVRKKMKPWDYAAAQKAAYLGFKMGNPDITVPIGSFYLYPIPKYKAMPRDGRKGGVYHYPLLPYCYEQLALENDCADYCDVFNYHTYDWVKNYSWIIGDLRNLLSKYGAGKIPIWITENGSRYEAMGKQDTHIQNKKDQNSDQQLIVAEFIPKSQIILQSLGIQRSFYFILVPYNEGNKVWGLLDWSYIAKPGFAAFSNLTYQLAAAKYLGTFKIKSGVKGFLYRQPDNTQTLVFWSESELDHFKKLLSFDVNTIPIDIKKQYIKNITIKVNKLPKKSEKKRYYLTDTFGKKAEISVKGGELKVISSKFPSYLSGLSGLKPDTVAPSSGIFRKRNSSKDFTVVIKACLTDKLSTKDRNTYATLTGESSDIFIEIYNFSDVAKTGQLLVTGNGKLEGIPETISLPAMGKIRLKAKYIPVLNSRNLMVADLTVKGIFNGKTTSRFFMPVFCSYQLENSTSSKSLEFNRPERWHKNSSGDMTISFDKVEKAVKFHVDFKNIKGGWAYPAYTLKTPKEKLKGAVGVSFEVKALQKDNSKGYSDSRVMVTVMNNGSVQTFSVAYPKPTTKWQKEIISFKDSLDGFNPANALKLSVGMNPKSNRVDFWIRNLKILYTK